MRSLSAWPYKNVGEPTPRLAFWYHCLILTVESLCLVGGSIYLKHNFGKRSFFELGHTYITFMMNVMAVIRLTLTVQTKYIKFVGTFINEFHLFHHKNRSSHAMKAHLLVHKISHLFTMYLNIITLCGIVLFNLLPFYNNIRSGAFSGDKTEEVVFEHCVYYALPFDYETKLSGYLVVFTSNLFISFVCSCCFCTFDLFISLIVFHVWGHLRILIQSMDGIPRPKDSKWYSIEESKQVFLYLRDVLAHHDLILNFISQMSDTFGFVLFTYYGFHQAAGCILLLECSQPDPQALIRYGPLTLILFQQLIQISIIFELLGAITDKLINAAYCLPWECMDTVNRKLVYMLLRQCQRSLSLKALGMIDVGCQTMVAIVKTSFSYFIMLRTLATDE